MLSLRDTYNWGEKRYLISDKPGSRITFPFVTQAKPGRDGQGEGYVKIGHLRSKVLGLGSIGCWVDDREEHKTRVDGWWDIKERNMGMYVSCFERFVFRVYQKADVCVPSSLTG